MPRSSLPPFLKKLRTITETVHPSIASWSEDGLSFCVFSSKFEETLSHHFKGNIQTFVRQLHFYGFRKFEAKGCEFCFAHKFFQRDNPELIYEIRRKTRGDTLEGCASVEDVKALEKQVTSLEQSVTDIREKLRRVSAKLGVEFNPKITKLHPNSPKAKSEKKTIRSKVNRSNKNNKNKATATTGARKENGAHPVISPPKPIDDNQPTMVLQQQLQQQGQHFFLGNQSQQQHTRRAGNNQHGVQGGNAFPVYVDEKTNPNMMLAMNARPPAMKPEPLARADSLQIKTESSGSLTMPSLERYSSINDDAALQMCMDLNDSNNEFSTMDFEEDYPGQTANGVDDDLVQMLDAGF